MNNSARSRRIGDFKQIIIEHVLRDRDPRDGPIGARSSWIVGIKAILKRGQGDTATNRQRLVLNEIIDSDPTSSRTA